MLAAAPVVSTGCGGCSSSPLVSGDSQEEWRLLTCLSGTVPPRLSDNGGIAAAAALGSPVSVQTGSILTLLSDFR